MYHKNSPIYENSEDLFVTSVNTLWILTICEYLSLNKIILNSNLDGITQYLRNLNNYNFLTYFGVSCTDYLSVIL